MTDDELIARLRSVHTIADCDAAADRIELLATTNEQLVATNEALSISNATLISERDQWIAHAKNAIWSDSEQLRLAEAKLEKAVKLIDLAVELARWDRAPKLRDDMIDFTTEIKSHSDEFATQKGESHE